MILMKSSMSYEIFEIKYVVLNFYFTIKTTASLDARISIKNWIKVNKNNPKNSICELVFQYTYGNTMMTSVSTVLKWRLNP